MNFNFGSITAGYQRNKSCVRIHLLFGKQAVAQSPAPWKMIKAQNPLGLAHGFFFLISQVKEMEREADTFPKRKCEAWKEHFGYLESTQ